MAKIKAQGQAYKTGARKDAPWRTALSVESRGKQRDLQTVKSVTPPQRPQPEWHKVGKSAVCAFEKTAGAAAAVTTTEAGLAAEATTIAGAGASTSTAAVHTAAAAFK